MKKKSVCEEVAREGSQSGGVSSVDDLGRGGSLLPAVWSSFSFSTGIAVGTLRHLFTNHKHRNTIITLPRITARERGLARVNCIVNNIKI